MNAVKIDLLMFLKSRKRINRTHKEKKMFTTQQFNSKILAYLAATVISLLALSLWSNISRADQGDERMRAPNISAREFWSSGEDIDTHIDAVKVQLLAQGADDQVLNSLEQYRTRLHQSMSTGEPLSNSSMESASFDSPKELMEELKARGISVENLDFDLEARFREFREARRSALSSNNDGQADAD